MTFDEWFDSVQAKLASNGWINLSDRDRVLMMQAWHEAQDNHPDTARLQWLADNMRLMSGHKDCGNWQLPTLVEWVASDRDRCTLDDLRAALDSKPEAA